MSLRLLLDENMSQVVAEQVMHHQPAMSVESVYTWRGGVFKGQSDRALLVAAGSEGLTLVTYDQKTIPPCWQNSTPKVRATQESCSWMIRP